MAPRSKRVKPPIPGPEFLRKLPNELITIIINACSSSDRAALLRVSKHLNQLAMKPLYNSISITSHSVLPKLEQTLFQRPEVAAMIRMFTVYFQTMGSYPSITMRPLRDIIKRSRNIEQLHLHADVSVASRWLFEIALLSDPSANGFVLPKLSRLVIGISPTDVDVPSLELCLSGLESLDHLTLQFTSPRITLDLSRSTIKLSHVKATLPNLKSYHGPPLLLQSLSAGSKMLSSLTLDVMGLHEGEGAFEGILKYLKVIGPTQGGGNSALSSLMVLCDRTEVAELVSRHIPNVVHLSFSHILTPSTMHSHPLLQVDLDYLSHIPSLRKFSIGLCPHYSELRLPDAQLWDSSVLAESIGKTLPGVLEMTIHGSHYRKAPEGTIWTLV